MAKDKKLAIKRIGIADVSQKSIATLLTSSALVFGERRIGFEVKEWSENAKKGDKQKIIWYLRHGIKVFKINQLDGNEIFWIDGIPNKLCGDLEYQIVASKQGVEGEAVFRIKGTASPLITDSSWTVVVDGVTNEIKNRQKTTPVPVGTKATLSLRSEGLNGKDLIIKFYAIRSFFENMSFDGLTDATANDIHLPGCDIKVKCVDGEVNVEMDTRKLVQSHFTLDKHIEGIYVRVISDGKKVKDGDPYNDTIHAVGLCIDTKKSVGSNNSVSTPTNTTTTRIGQNLSNPIKYSSCTFDELSLTVPQSDLHVPLFKDGITHFSQANKKQHYIKEENIYFEIDRDLPDADNQAKLKQLAAYLVKTKNELELTGYADNTGSNKHNDHLAARRVANVQQILIDSGVNKDAIRIGSYGKYKSTGESKDNRTLDRKVSIRYDLYMSKQQRPIVYQIVATDKDYPLPVEIKFNGFSVEGCQMPDKHKHKAELSIETPTKTESLPCGESGVINLDVYSGTYTMDYYDFLNILYGYNSTAILQDTTVSDQINIYEIGLHTCNYYSDSAYPTMALMIYPDVNLVYNFRYDFEEMFPFRDLNFGLVKGAPMLHEWKETFDKMMAPFYDITDSIGIGENGEEVSLKEIIDDAWNEILSRIDIFQTGVHAAYNFVDKQPISIRDFTKENYITTQITHIIYAACQLIVELLIQFLLKGKGKGAKGVASKGTASKTTKPKGKSLLDKFQENPMDYITTPRIAESAGLYYEQKPLGVSRMYDLHICAKPLLGVKYIKTVDLVKNQDQADSILKTSSLISWFNSNKNKIQKAEFTIEVNGDLNLDHRLLLDSLNKNITSVGLTKDFNDPINNNYSLNVTPELQLTFKLQFDIAGSITETISFLDIDLAKLDAEYKAKGKDITSTLQYRRVYNFSTKEDSYYRHEVEFSGVKGKLFQKVNGKLEDAHTWGIDAKFDTNKNNKEIEFNWAPDKIFRTDPIPFPFL